MGRRILRIAGAVFGLLLILLGLVVTAPPGTGLVVAPFRAWLVQSAAQRLSGALNGTVELGVLEGSLLRAPGFSGVVIRDPTGTAVVRLDAVRLHYAPLSLLRGSLVIHEMEVVRPHVTLSQARDGTLNLARLAHPSPRNEARTGGNGSLNLPVAIELKSLRVRDGGSHLALDSLKGVTAISDVQIALTGRADATGLHLAIEEFSARTHPAQVNLASLRGTVRATATQLQFDQLRLQTGSTQADLNLLLPRGTAPVRITVAANPLDVSEVGRLLARDDLRGQLHADLQAQGPRHDIGLRADLSAAAGQVRLEGRLDTAANPATYGGRVSVRDLDLGALADHEALESDLNLTLEVEGRGLSPRTVEGTLLVSVEPSHLGDIRLDASRIRVLAQSERFHVEAFELNSSMASVRATGSLDFRGASDLVYEASADLSQLQPLLGSAPLGGSLHLLGSVAGSWPDLRAAGSLTADDVTLGNSGFQRLELDYQGRQLGARPVASARLRLQELAVGDLPIATAELQAACEGSLRHVTFTSRVAQPPQMESHVAGRLTLGGAVRRVVFDTAELRYADRTWHAPQPLEIALGPGTLDVRSFHLKQGEESVTLSGRIQDRVLHGVRVEASSIDLTDLQARLGLHHAVGGRASLLLQAGGPFLEPAIRGNLLVTGSPGEDLPFDRLQAALQYASRELTGQIAVRQDDRDVLQSEFVAPLDLALADVALSERLLDGPLNLSLRLRRPDLTSLPAVMPAAALSGDLQGDVSVRGTYAQLELAAEMDLQNGGMEGMIEEIYAPVRLRAELALADSVPLLAEALESNALTGRLRVLELAVSAAGGRLPAGGSEGTTRPVGLANARLHGDATWSTQGFEATIAGLEAETDAFGFPASLSASARLTGTRLELRHLRVATAKSRMEATGHMTLADRRFELAVEIPRLAPGDVGVVIPASLSGEVHGGARLEGSPSHLALTAGVRYGEAGLQVQGTVDWPNASFAADVTLTDLAMDRFVPAGAGRLNAHLSVRGSGFAAPQREAELNLSFASPAFSLAPELQGAARAVLTGSAVRLDEVRIDSVPLQLTAAGAASDDREVQAEYQLVFKDLAPLALRTGGPIQAHGSLSGSLGGALDALRARGELRLESWAYGDFGGEKATVTFEGEDLVTRPRASVTGTFEGVHGRALPASSATLEGWFHEQQVQLDFAVTGGPYRKTRVAGRVDLRGEQAISLDTLHLHYRHWSWENPGPVRIVRRPDGAVRLADFRLRSGEQAIQAAGHVHPSGALEASILVDQAEIEPWLLTFLPAMPAAGRMNLRLDVTGSTESPEASGVLQMRDLAWKDLPLGRIHVASSFKNGRLDNHLQWHDGDREILEIRGALGLRDDFPLDLAARSSSLDLARLAAVFDVVHESGGSLDLQLHARGTVAAPDLRGDLAIRKGALRLASTGEPYRDIEARLTLAGNRLEIGSLTAASSTGTLRAGGWLEIGERRLKHVALDLQAHDFTVMNTDAVQGRLRGVLEARGPLDALAVSGAVTIPRARIRLDDFGAGPAAVSPADLTVSGVYNGDPEKDASNGELEEAEPRSPLVRGLRTELSVRLPRNAWVVGPETAVEIQGTLLVNKSADEPFVLGGSAQTVRGHVTYRGRKFNLERGRITFSGAEENKPILDVVARHEVSDYTITLHVTGDSRRPQLTFSSFPELPEEDILSLIAFGKTIDRLSGSEKTALSSQGAAIAGNIISGILEKRLGDTFGLDTLEVEVGDELGTGSVRGGRYVTQDVFLSYERQLGEKSGNTVEVEYSLGPRVKLKGASDDKGQSSVDILWHIEY